MIRKVGQQLVVIQHHGALPGQLESHSRPLPSGQITRFYVWPNLICWDSKQFYLGRGGETLCTRLERSIDYRFAFQLLTSTIQESKQPAMTPSGIRRQDSWKQRGLHVESDRFLCHCTACKTPRDLAAQVDLQSALDRVLCFKVSAQSGAIVK